jgi:ADP-ribose pyrophosphatase
MKKKPLDRYFDLLKEYPHLITEPLGEGVIKVITDSAEIASWQKKRKEELLRDGRPLEWAEIGVLVDDPWYWVIRDLVEFPNGFRNGYIRFVNRKSLEGGYNVIVLPKINHKILLIKHFRHETRTWHWETPRGFGEPGLSAKENAMKELKEEIGITAVSLDELAHIKNSDGSTVFFLAELKSDDIQLDLGEGIVQFKLVSISELEEWIRSGKLTDAYTLVPYLLTLLDKKEDVND